VRVLFDTNVVLDVLLEREPHVRNATALFAAIDRGWLTGLLCATTITTVYYIGSQGQGRAYTHKKLEELLAMFTIAPVTSSRRCVSNSQTSRMRFSTKPRSPRTLKVSSRVTRKTSDQARFASTPLLPLLLPCAPFTALREPSAQQTRFRGMFWLDRPTRGVRKFDI
jgi:predicted nucleic acid-binding protein